MFIVRFSNADANTRSVAWTAEEDCTIVAAQRDVAAGGCIITDDPTASWLDALVTGSRKRFLMKLSVNGTCVPPFIDFPVYAGETIYCAFSANIQDAYLFLNKGIS
jgi:hypothetical protein